MKINTKIYLLLVCIVFLPLFSQPVAGLRILGIPAEDGTAIQVYRPVTGTSDFYFPQDCKNKPDNECLLPVDEFYVYIDFLDYDNSSRNVTFFKYELEYSLVRFQNPNTGDWIYKNVSDYSNLVSNVTLVFHKGDNEDNDPRYAIKKIDSSIWNDLTATDKREKIVVKYLDKTISFWHLTNYDLVPITQTHGEANGYVYLVLFIANFGIICGGLLLGKLTKYVNRVYPAIPFSAVVIAVLIFIISYLVNLLASGLTGDTADFLRQFSGVKPEYVSIMTSIMISIWIPSRFRNESLGEVLILELTIPYENRKELFEKLAKRELNDLKSRLDRIIPWGNWKTLHYYNTWLGKKVYTEDPNSVFGFFTNLLFGGIKIDWESTTVIKAGKKKKDEIILTTGFEEGKVPILDKKYAGYIYGGLSGSAILFLILSLVIKEFIIVSIASVSFLVLIWFYVNLEDKKQILIKPMGRNAAAAIYDSTVVNEMEADYDDTLVENVDLLRTRKFEIARKEYSARYESFLLFAGITYQDDFTENLPKYLEILDAVGLETSNNKFSRSKKSTSSTENEYDEDNDDINEDNEDA